jgi:hypothetical protein
MSKPSTSKITYNCENCGVSVSVWLYRYKRAKHHHYCGRKCKMQHQKNMKNELISAELRSRWKNPEYREHMVSIASGSNNPFYGHQHTDEFKAFIGERNRHPLTPEQTKARTEFLAEYRAKETAEQRTSRLDNLRIALNRPSHKALLSMLLSGESNPRFGKTPPESSGRCRWATYHSRTGEAFRLQGTSEIRTAIVLDAMPFNWSAHGPATTLRYTTDAGVKRTYHPDFFVPELSLYIETKGYYDAWSKQKMALVRQANPIYEFLVLTTPMLKLWERLWLEPSDIHSQYYWSGMAGILKQRNDLVLSAMTLPLLRAGRIIV